MTAGIAFIIGLIINDAKIMIIGTNWGDVRKAIEDWCPWFFKELPKGYERYIDSTETTGLMTYLYNTSKEGSAVHMRAFLNLFSMFVEELYVDDRDLDIYVWENYRAYEFDDLKACSKFFTQKDQRYYLNRIYPMSERYN